MSHAPIMRRRLDICLPSLNKAFVRLLTLLTMWIAGGVTQIVAADDVQMAWDGVSDSRVAYYEVHHGLASGNYVEKVTTTGTTAVVAGPAPGQTYYFAARACEQGGTACSAFSNEVSVTVPGTPPPLSMTTASLANGTIGLGYSATLAATGGTVPYSWTIASGLLPSGLTLNAATGSITGTPTAAATSNFTVQVRDSASPATTISKVLSITVSATPTNVTIWPSTAVPGSVDGGPDGAVELGVKFRSDVAGTITGIRFYKASTNTGTHVGNLWSSTGMRLATATFTNETASGWQQVNFSSPVPIAANTVYVASYHANTGHYSADVNYFATAGVDTPPLHALASGVSGGNGVYAYGTGSAFPTQTWNAANYWVDVVFSPGSARTLQSIAVTPVNPAIPIGATQQFTAAGTYSDSSTQNLTAQVTWTSANTAVATIGAAGMATGLGAGQTTISAALDGVTGAGSIQVLPPPVANFGASTRSGFTPLTTTFSDLSSGQVTAWSWEFGDGGTSKAATAVHTYTAAGTYAVSLSVSGPGGGDEEVKSAFITVNSSAPVANFTGDVLQGTAPLAVAFHNDSTGQVTASAWNFGDGDTSNETHPSHTYTEPGLYTVTLTVSGPGGSNTLPRSAYVQIDAPALPMEVGTVSVNDQWQRVNFETAFSDPIVVANPLSNDDGNPAVVRMYGVDRNGFWIRVQEWDYLDGTHPYETVSYMVMERGRHELPDGGWVEAGRLAKGTTAFATASFSEAFIEAPVVFSTITSVNEGEAVVPRMRQISATGFQVRIQEQESNRQKHLPESIDFIAWEPSFGVVNGMRYEVGRVAASVSNKVQTVVYQGAFTQPPLFLADMQTTNGGEPGNLRWRNRNEVSVEVWVSEEQSKDTETTHSAESVGYFAADETQ
jgi:PKD repeat protein